MEELEDAKFKFCMFYFLWKKGNMQKGILTDSDNKVLSAYDVAMYVYEKAKNIDEKYA